ncbi:hypothetical protein BT63DRAFT_457791 [Microthyrium microscopicum]|uniref:Zn(2)-C6 fungal-type domain-containing protein n=1 Tax=Microthyrium microscopicum TaxID=703497 RepID=A0A6A6U799_9PEZI|nr:hypothetical protein BT63DRAFT_457791 [Microthyrium microscopicum]
MGAEVTDQFTSPGIWSADLTPSPRSDAISSAGKHHAERQTLDSGPGSRSAVSVACTGCRSRHLKCDGQRPCSRCSSEAIDCSYIKSRRGWKGPRIKSGNAGFMPSISMSSKFDSNNPQEVKHLNRQYGGSGATCSAPTHTPLLSLSPQIDTSVLDTSNVTTETLAMSPDGRFSLDFIGPTQSHGQIVLQPPPPAQLLMDTTSHGLVNAFYTFFYAAHPFVLPRSQLLDLLRSQDKGHLELALQFIGSFYVVGANSEELRYALQHSLSRVNVSKDAFYVQSMLLLAIGLHMADHEPESANVMYAAIDVALNIGMNRRHFGTTNGGVGTLLEECLRRTWWEVYVCDGMFAGVNPVYNLRLKEVSTDVPLPIEDNEYFQGCILSEAKTFDDYEESVFETDEIVFSSGTYRIDAIRVVQQVLTATRANPIDQNALDMADTHLANWALHLPDCKKKIINREAMVDEVLFEAHMIIAACSILLHRPRSDLSHEDVREVKTCVNTGPMGIASNYTDMHTAKAMRAAMDICVLIKMPCPLAKHSPFFTCAITMAAVCYLSYWSFIATEEGDNLIKEHIRLNIGSLKTLAGVMPIAKTVLGQVKGVAQELFQSRKALKNLYFGAVTREEILQGMIEEVPHSGSMPAMTLPSWDVGFANGS